MKGLCTAVLASVISGAFAAPAPAPAPAPTEKADVARAAKAACATPVTLTGNPFSGRKIYANKFYSSEVISAASAISDPTLKAAATKVAEVGTFMWM